jgi:hypothetical protein
MNRVRGYPRSRLALPGLALPLLASLLLLAAAPASASMVIGQVSPTPPAPTCSAAADYLEPSVTGGNLYVAKAAGTITSWSTNSAGAGAEYTFKVFRRTRDPDVFQAIAHAQGHTLGIGLNTFPTAINVASGDMIGLNVSGGSSSCTFPLPGDAVLQANGDLGDGASAQFATVQDVRLNLQAVLVPSNAFTVTGVSLNRHNGTALLTLDTTNPGVVTIAGKGLKSGRAARTRAVAGPVSFRVGAKGKPRRRLVRKGVAHLAVTISFAPTGGDPSSQVIPVKLKLRRQPRPD